MIRPRIIPVLLLKDGGLCKTSRFTNPIYVGDPINTMRIFNDKEVDEIILLDIAAHWHGRGPDTEKISTIVSESFMPLAYGGGISRYEQAMRLFDVGVEKIILNTVAYENPDLVTQIASSAGSQAVVVSIDVATKWFSGKRVMVRGGKKNTGSNAVDYAKKAVELGAGEIMLTSIDREGSMQGYDLELLKSVAQSVNIPVIAHGGAGKFSDFRLALHNAHVSALAVGSMFVFQGPHRAVLINYPTAADIDALMADLPDLSSV